MDRDRYRKRVRDLNACAEVVDQLTRVPAVIEKASEKDFRQVADLLRGAAEDVEALLDTEKHYEDAEKKLKDEVRVRLVAAALSGTAGAVLVTADLEVEDVVDGALQIADRAIWALTKEDA
jgi:hypothetical protein